LLMAFAAILALGLSNALQAFDILLQIGAGTGLIFILRWFWWRINAYTEISAMIVSFFVAIYFEIVHEAIGFDPMLSHWKLLVGVGITTASWLLVTLLTAPEKDEVLLSFYRKVRPAAYGWNSLLKRYPNELAETGKLPMEIGLMLVASLMVYSTVFATGYWIYGNTVPAVITTAVSIIGGVVLFKAWSKLK
jgi:SSS family solute:Na+ symporter